MLLLHFIFCATLSAATRAHWKANEISGHICPGWSSPVGEWHEQENEGKEVHVRGNSEQCVSRLSTWDDVKWVSWEYGHEMHHTAIETIPVCGSSLKDEPRPLTFDAGHVNSNFVLYPLDLDGNPTWPEYRYLIDMNRDAACVPCVGSDCGKCDHYQRQWYNMTGHCIHEPCDVNNAKTTHNGFNYACECKFPLNVIPGTCECKAGARHVDGAGCVI